MCSILSQEKYINKGGPDGGDGGEIATLFCRDEGLRTLGFRYKENILPKTVKTEGSIVPVKRKTL